MKITTSIDNIKSFGGLNFISAEFDKLKLPELITLHLGKRSLQAKYSFSDAIKNLWAITFAGGDCAEDIHTNLKDELLLLIIMQSIPLTASLFLFQFSLYIPKTFFRLNDPLRS